MTKLKRDASAPANRDPSFALMLLGILESAISLFATILLFRPTWTMRLDMCPIDIVDDWDVSKGYEVPYPRWSFFLLYFTIWTVVVFFSRTFLTRRIVMARKTVRGPALDAVLREAVKVNLFPIPVLLILHATFPHLIFYGFPYVALLFSIFLDMFVIVSFGYKSSVNWATFIFRYALLVYSYTAIFSRFNTRFFYVPAFFLPFAHFIYYVTKKFTEPNLWRL